MVLSLNLEMMMLKWLNGNMLMLSSVLGSWVLFLSLSMQAKSDGSVVFNLHQRINSLT